jgi:molybdenum cofactor guanylyltransferase
VKRHALVAAFVLAGGASTRMGRDKSLIEIAGIPIIVRTARLIEPLVTSVTIVGAPERYKLLGLRVLADKDLAEKEPDGRPHGPLAGIASALASTTMPWNLILACDLPYLTREWVNWLLLQAVNSQAQVLIPNGPGGLEPLAAVYRRECADTAAEALSRGVRKVTDALVGLRIQAVDPKEWSEVDPTGRVLSNMNTPRDCHEAQIWWEGKAAGQL